MMRYGRPITGDAIRAMEHGPVPAFAYDLLQDPELYDKQFGLEDSVVKALQPPNLDCLSESELECMVESIDDNSELNFAELKSKSIDAAYEDAVRTNGMNAVISYIEIAKAAGAKEELIAYICDKIENNDCK